MEKGKRPNSKFAAAVGAGCQWRHRSAVDRNDVATAGQRAKILMMIANVSDTIEPSSSKSSFSKVLRGQSLRLRIYLRFNEGVPPYPNLGQGTG